MTSSASTDAALGPDGWRIRLCVEAEAESLVELWRLCGATASPTDVAQDVRIAIRHPAASVLVAEYEGTVIGSVIGTFDGWRGNIYRLAVLPEVRRRGCARSLVAEAERRMLAQGARRISALVEKDHPWATGFWQSEGYDLDARMSRYVKNFGA